MKRILIFSTAYDPFVGGAEVAVSEITQRLRDVRFIMITARLNKNLSDKEQIGNVEVHRIGKGNNWDKFRLILSGHKKAQELGEFDLVWSIMASYAGFATLRYKKRNKQVPFLLTLQEGDSRWDIYKHVWFIWPYFKQIFKRADKIQAISNYLADWAKSMSDQDGSASLGGAKGKIEVIPNGISTGYEIRNTEYGGDEITKVMTASRLVKKNGVGDLIKAIDILKKDYNLKVELNILGDGELRSELEKLVSDLKIETQVNFLGNVSNNEVYSHLAQADVFCRPSLSEGLGNAFLEAMSVGVPVVATPVGGIPDFLEEGKTGWFCQVKDPRSIAEKIKYILDEKNREEVSRVVENARKMVEEKYNWDLIADNMNKIFVSL